MLRLQLCNSALKGTQGVPHLSMKGSPSHCFLQANFKRAYGQFNDDFLEGCAKQTEFRSLVFALSYFHAALLERKKFGVGNLPGARSGPPLGPWTIT